MPRRLSWPGPGTRSPLLEARDVVGGRAGSWEEGGFRFDTGPSWYFMPEVFDHFYRLLGTSAREQFELVTLDPGYRIYFEGQSAPLDIAASRAENVEDLRGSGGAGPESGSAATWIRPGSATTWPNATFSTRRSRNSGRCFGPTWCCASRG
ncbi:MAG: FAD-dependent oxidoreductase [Galbitalea sp.]